jgi:(2Fe-2S) ferredoxin
MQERIGLRDATRGAILLRVADRNPAARQRFHQLTTRLQALEPALVVLAAYVSPGVGSDLSPAAAVEQLIERGIDNIVLIPDEVEWPYPEAYDVPDALYDLAAQHPSVSLRLGRPLGLDEQVDGLLARRLSETWDLPPVGEATVRQIAGIAGQTPVTSARIAPGDLPRLPSHAQHVFICAGRRCMEEGSADTYRALEAHLAARGLDAGPSRVKVTRTKCLSPCQAAPVGCVYPAGTFHCRLDAETVQAFVEHVLTGSGALPGHTFRPGDLSP